MENYGERGIQIQLQNRNKKMHHLVWNFGNLEVVKGRHPDFDQ